MRVLKPNLRLKGLLWERGISQRRLAVEAGLSETLLSKCVRWGEATPDMRRAISEYLEVPEREIFPND